jgi:hypothetical protein
MEFRMLSKRTKQIVAITLLFTFSALPSSSGASRSQIDAAFKNIYREMVAQGNNDAIAAMTYYDTEIRQAIGKILDRKVNCDTRSKNAYKVKAFNTMAPEVDQVINGFYLGYCNAR